MTHPLLTVLKEARACSACASFLPLGPKPLLAADPESRILIIGQAPGKATHVAGIPWQDRSGDTLRKWLGVSREQFYDPKLVALVPTGFCYPGTGTTGDLPPRPECAPLWHPRILPELRQVQLTIYLGSYAFARNMGDRYPNLTAAAADFAELLPKRIVLPHPSPRNGMWASQRPWFAGELIPALQSRVLEIIAR